MKPHDSNTKIFRLPWAYYNLIMPCVVGLMLVVIYFISSIMAGVDLLTLLIVGTLWSLTWGGVAGYSWWIFENNWLAISPDGIEYRAPGVYTYAHWTNLEYIGPYHITAGRYSRTLTVIYLKERKRKPQTFKILCFPIVYTTPPIIPISDFDSQWSQGEIGRLLRQHAPQLTWHPHKNTK
jgi:hypothetical protein